MENYSQRMVYEVAVVVPVTRMAGKLDNLESWLRIVETTWQIIIVHDSQDEETSHELHELVASIANKNIFLSEGKYGNPGDTRNSAIGNIQSRWTLFWDCDDYGDVPTIASWIHENPTSSTDLVVFRFQKRIIDTNHLLGFSTEWSSDNKTNIIAWGLEPGLWRCLIRSGIIEDVRFPAISMGEDQVFLAQIAQRIKFIQFSNEVAYTYFVGNPNQLTNSLFSLNDVLYAKTEIESCKFFENTELNIFTKTIKWKMMSTLFLRSSKKKRMLIVGVTLRELISNWKEIIFVLRLIGARLW